MVNPMVFSSPVLDGLLTVLSSPEKVKETIQQLQRAAEASKEAERKALDAQSDLRKSVEESKKLIDEAERARDELDRVRVAQATIVRNAESAARSAETRLKDATRSFDTEMKAQETLRSGKASEIAAETREAQAQLANVLQEVEVAKRALADAKAKARALHVALGAVAQERGYENGS